HELRIALRESIDSLNSTIQNVSLARSISSAIPNVTADSSSNVWNYVAKASSHRRNGTEDR
ncbi:MAG TPA: hypothetical protein VJQ54_23045, partial [Candidatus Sulfotelmatobacter sp.]|nr:hypothetical protein [Candidatus Sulfotelmatobacter sp.]